MNYAFLPDLSAMTILIVILLLLRQRHPQEQADIWLLGLLITLVESGAHIFYAQNGPIQRGLHIIVLDCYLLAGVVFTWDSRHHPLSSTVRFLYLLLNALPLLAITTTYGLHIYTPGAYYPAVTAGLLVAGASSLYLRRTWLVTVIHLCGWLAIGYLIRQGDYREAVYWSLSGIYTIAALKFQRRLPRQSTGRLAILVGFYIWALCFLLHPWVVHYRSYADIASHAWNMQKSLISIGMILVMLEEQVSNNQWLALHDELTGLPNRRSFENRLNCAIDRCRRMKGNLALLMLDLNGFKNINDSLGHQAGDQVLRGVARNLRENVPGFDTLARLGGDEFTLIAFDLKDDRAINQLLNIIQSAVEKPLIIDGQTLTVTASLGHAIYPSDADDATRLLQIADQRMYTLKQKLPPGARIEVDLTQVPLLQNASSSPIKLPLTPSQNH
jgi:diguanylate cyclase (GGDEF)-like protein